MSFFGLLLTRYQLGLAEPMKGSSFVCDNIDGVLQMSYNKSKS